MRADELIDRESSIAVKSLSKKETKREGPEEGDLKTLFDGKIPEEKGKENSENGTVVTEPEKDNFPVNILDQNRNQLIADQKSDVTLEKIRRSKRHQKNQMATSSQMTSCFIAHISQMSIMELGMLILLFSSARILQKRNFAGWTHNPLIRSYG